MEDHQGTSRARLVVQGRERTWSHELGEKTLIGRGGHCDVQFDDERVSIDHAEVVRHGSSFLLTDLGSRNGTVINGRAGVTTQRLRNADVVQIGPYRFEVRLPFHPTTSKDRSRSVKLSDEERLLAAALAAPFREGAVSAARAPTHRALADQLHLSESTVKRRLDALARKLQVPTDAGADRARLIADRVIALGLDRDQPG